MRIEFAAYAGDCRVTGDVDLEGDRLTDMLDHEASVTVRNAVLESLEDGHRIRFPELVLERDDLLVVAATGPRGHEARRIHTVRHRLQVQVGPYMLLGHLHARPGAAPLVVVGQRGPMIPMTDATIAYVSGGVLEMHDATTLIVNRARIDWVRADVDSLPLVSSVGLAHLLLPGTTPA